VRVLLVLAVLLAIVPAARAADPAIEDGSAQAALDAARAQWEQEGLRNYGYRVRASCFCPLPYVRAYDVHVRDGKPVRSHRYIRGWDTVEELFERIQRAIDGDAFSLFVEYGERGVPRSIAINQGEYIFDEELGLTVRRLHGEPAKLPPKVALSILDGTARQELRAARGRWRQAGRPQASLATRRFARIADAISRRVARLEVRYAGNGVPRRVRIG
jgi:uncharacterized protein DUF6174